MKKYCDKNVQPNQRINRFSYLKGNCHRGRVVHSVHIVPYSNSDSVYTYSLQSNSSDILKFVLYCDGGPRGRVARKGAEGRGGGDRIAGWGEGVQQACFIPLQGQDACQHVQQETRPCQQKGVVHVSVKQGLEKCAVRWKFCWRCTVHRHTGMSLLYMCQCVQITRPHKQTSVQLLIIYNLYGGLWITG
jgi:hypothetical protein